jgi:hypothetical protein
MVRNWLINWAKARSPHFVIGGHEQPYMLRWFLIPRNPLLNIYIHHFMRSDDDRALHDHPWINASILLEGSYLEHTISAGGINHRHEYQSGDIKVRLSGKYAHRIELHNGPVWTLFITGPRYRRWGFHCPDAGWIHWKKFTATDDSGAIGKGCDQ